MGTMKDRSVRRGASVFLFPGGPEGRDPPVFGPKSAFLINPIKNSVKKTCIQSQNNLK